MYTCAYVKQIRTHPTLHFRLRNIFLHMIYIYIYQCMHIWAYICIYMHVCLYTYSVCDDKCSLPTWLNIESLWKRFCKCVYEDFFLEIFCWSGGGHFLNLGSIINSSWCSQDRVKRNVETDHKHPSICSSLLIECDSLSHAPVAMTVSSNCRGNKPLLA